MKRLSCFLGILLSLSVVAQPLALNLDQLHTTLIGFYQYQRAGRSDGSSGNPYYSSITSNEPHYYDNHNGNSLEGGWYDAGDFLKLGLPLGYTIYCLLKGYDVFPHSYDRGTNGIPNVLEEAKVGTDYLLKAIISETEVVMDLGDPNVDHMGMDESGPDNSQRTQSSRQRGRVADGVDVPAYYAASLALMSIVYREFDEDYADQCLEKAKQAFRRAETAYDQGNMVSTPTTKHSHGVLYSNSEGRDKMAAAAIELYRATGETSYRDWAESLTFPTISNVMGYGNAVPLASFEMWRQGVGASSTGLLNDMSFIWRNREGADNPRMEGIYVNSDWGTARDAGNAAFVAALAYIVTGNDSYMDFVETQINWLTGNHSGNSQSFVVGFSGGPSRIHHRNARHYGTPPRGGVVSGPDDRGEWDDDYSYRNCEVALDYNAGAIGAVAFLKDLANPPAGQIQIPERLEVSPQNVDFNSSDVTISARLSGTVDWTIDIRGVRSGATKLITGSGSNINETWIGDADQGTFIVGEEVRFNLDAGDNVALYHFSRTFANIEQIGGVKVFPFTDSDVLIDDFTGGNTPENALGGTWSTFNDGVSSSRPTEITESAVTDDGYDGSPGLQIRLIGQSGEDIPYTGIKTSFHPENRPMNLGEPTSIVFDIKASNTEIRVEVEQTTITDGAYYGYTVGLHGSNQWTRVRVPISELRQPEWATESKDLDLRSVNSLRFTYYGTSMPQVTIDNVHIENLSLSDGDVSAARRPVTMEQTRASVSGSSLNYTLSAADARGNLQLEIYNVSGRRVVSKNFAGTNQVSIPLSGLPAGVYTVIGVVDGRKINPSRFVWSGR
ncbi:glycoside hydrolase family 9 protein [Chitinispirillales bacterium ANBcel5]|uniref:glycoside hydrolase family 9 protein n=1 Tax=Cellulosispirillum alkaliphilum TaxID=3039283 RepID=UPI002A5585D8|nr:glycoside hydrolase family 9 protein [Chitinispirillales bacterium ANBcel5]